MAGPGLRDHSPGEGLVGQQDGKEREETGRGTNGKRVLLLPGDMESPLCHGEVVASFDDELSRLRAD